MHEQRSKCFRGLMYQLLTKTAGLFFEGGASRGKVQDKRI